MNSVIRITERTSVDDVLAWEVQEETKFVISRSSGFVPGAQGVAMTALRTIAQKPTRVSILCEFPRPTTSANTEELLFGTPFGFSLVRQANSINFATDPIADGRSFKRAMGQLYVSKRGRLGFGRQTSLLAVDPRFPFPPALKDDVYAGDSNFPPPSKFQAVLTGMAESIGFSRALTSATESHLVSYIYELTRNTWEHGVPATRTVSGSTRAVILEKIVLQTNESARGYPEYLQSYLTRIQSEFGSSLGVGVLCVTVVDQGDGIQATLPQLDGESETERLERAFGDGQSRKPTSAVSRGLGLSKAISSAFQLRALLQVCSGGLLGTQDFSTGEQKYPGVDLVVKTLPEKLKFGTSISLFVPEFASSLDQPSLFKA